MTRPVTVQRPRFRLAARVQGELEGVPWIVLSNSLGATMMMWEPQLALLRRHYRVLSYDTRGHGASESPPGPYRFDDLVDDVIALMDHLGIETAAYMGLSLGGMTGLGLAIAHPERIERLVCCDARADAPPPYVQGWDDRIAAIDRGGLSAIVSGTMERWFVEPWRSSHPEHLKRFEQAFLETSADGYKGCAAALKELDYLRQLGCIRVPVLYVAGEMDSAAPSGAMRAMADATPGAGFEIVPNAAHLSNIDNSEDFNRAIAPFLGLG